MGADDVATPAWPARRLLRALLALWLVAAALLLVAHRHGIAIHAYPDPDDLLRLVEVRDWMAGQAFRDVSQHRMNPPAGAPMHWSRLVDMPIAAVRAGLRPLVGAASAETGSAIVVPLLTLGIVMLAVALSANAVGGPVVALVAAGMAALSPAAQVQLQPLRVDHHGWEIACSTLALAASVALRGWRSGVGAGVAIAFGLQISLEQLPFAAALGAAIAVRFASDPSRERREALAGFAASLAIVEAVLFFGLHAPGERGGWCDATTSPHVVALGIVAAGCVAVAWFAPGTGGWRIAALALVAVIAAAIFHAIPPHCGLDSFSMLEPIVREHWLDRVSEGLPLWRSNAATGVAFLGVPLMGIVAAAVAARTTAGAARADWLLLLAMAIVATIVGLLVMRAMVLANVVAMPALGWALIRVLGRVAHSGRSAVRVLGGAGAVLALNPLAPAMLAAAMPDPSRDEARSQPCLSPAAIATLDRLPPSRIFAPFDFGPAILFATRHSVLASGHHRNHRAMAVEIRTWLSSDDAAERTLRKHGFDYVLLCTPSVEASRYATDAPHGFAAHLLAGRTPAWLRPVPLAGTLIRLWRIAPVPTQPPGGRPSSRSAGGGVPTASQIARSAALSPSS